MQVSQRNLNAKKRPQRSTPRKDENRVLEELRELKQKMSVIEEAVSMKAQQEERLRTEHAAKYDKYALSSMQYNYSPSP